MNNEDAKKQSQTTQHQPTQSQNTTDQSQNKTNKTGENKTQPQDVSKKNPEQGGSTQDHGKDKATYDKHEKAS